MERTGVTSHDPRADNESIGAFEMPMTVVRGLDRAAQDTIWSTIAWSDRCRLEDSAGRECESAVGMFTPGGDRVSEGGITQVEPLGERLEKVDVTLLRKGHRAAKCSFSWKAMIKYGQTRLSVAIRWFTIA